MKTNMIYLYDGTYTGLITALSLIQKRKQQSVDICDIKTYQPGIFDQTYTVKSDEDEAVSFLDTLRITLPAGGLKHIFRVFLSNVSQKESRIYEYICFGLLVGKQLDSYLWDERVAFIHDYSRKVSLEAHRMRGLVRFSELEDKWLYAPIKTDHYVLPLIVGYFSQRISQKRWIIHDIKRKKIALYQSSRYRIFDVKSYKTPQISSREKQHKKMWQEYFKSIAIKERKNPKLQRQFMPKRYWQYLTEMEDIHNHDNCKR